MCTCIHNGTIQCIQVFTVVEYNTYMCSQVSLKYVHVFTMVEYNVSKQCMHVYTGRIQCK